MIYEDGVIRKSDDRHSRQQEETIKFRQLRYFTEAVEARSMSAAADKLHIVQSAVSHQIALLESDLGVALLIRSKAGVVPTKAGTVLYRHARTLLKGINTARQAVLSGDSEISGKVSIGMPSGVATLLAVPLLRATRERFPQVVLGIIEGLSTMQSDRLRAGELGLAILYQPQESAGIEVVPLVSEALHLLSGRPSAGRTGTISLPEAVARPLVLPPHPSAIRAMLQRECSAQGLGLTVVADLSSARTVMEAVRAGIADTISTIASAQVSPEYRDLDAGRIVDPEIRRTVHMARQQSVHLTKAEQALGQLAIGIAHDLVATGQWPGGSWIGKLRATTNGHSFGGFFDQSFKNA